MPFFLKKKKKSLHVLTHSVLSLMFLHSLIKIPVLVDLGLHFVSCLIFTSSTSVLKCVFRTYKYLTQLYLPFSQYLGQKVLVAGHYALEY